MSHIKAIRVLFETAQFVIICWGFLVVQVIHEPNLQDDIKKQYKKVEQNSIYELNDHVE